MRALWIAALLSSAALMGCLSNDYTGALCNDDGTCNVEGITGYVCIEGHCQLGELPRDAGYDAGVDAGSDAGVDAGADEDAGIDAGIDAGTDAGFDAGIDAGFDAGIDAGFDAGIDAGFDAGFDAGSCLGSCQGGCCIDGSTAARAGHSCKSIFDLNTGAPSGAYWIDPDQDGGRGPVSLFCDMAAGGWTLIGKVKGDHNMAPGWLTQDIDVGRLTNPDINDFPDGGYACVNAVWMAVNAATEVRLANSDRSQSVRWAMTPGRTLATWWQHSFGQSSISSSASFPVTVYRGATSQTCRTNQYGLNPRANGSGAYPSTYQDVDAGELGAVDAGDLCMSVSVLKTFTADGFSQDGFSRDAPTSESDWPNANTTSPPRVSVWVR